MLDRRTTTRLALAVLALSASSCSIRKMAVNALGDAMAGAGDTYASDEDPELVGGAIPFALKTIESLLAESPRHEGLLLAAASGFTQYAYAFVEQRADFLEDEDYTEAVEQWQRAKKLYLRAQRYGMRGLETHFDRFEQRLRDDPEAVLAEAKVKHVPLLYWTAAGWGAAMALAVDDAELTADQFQIEAMARRALELDEDFEEGAIHDFFISFEGSRPSAAGGSAESARHHLERALEISNGRRAFPLVSYAEAVSVAEQDREEFERLLERALAIDIEAMPEARLANVVAQERARWLLGRTDELFIE